MNQVLGNTRLESSRRFWSLLSVYGLMIAATVGGFLLIRMSGESMMAGASASALRSIPQAKPPVKVDTLPHLLGALLAIIVAGRCLGTVLQWFGQPRVIGEVIAGILLGPSLLGRISPDAMHFVLPTSVAPLLGVIAQLGVILYMFLVGLDLNPDHLKSKAHSTVAISHASIVAPFLLGAILALWLYPSLAPADVSFTSFALFMGVAMAITAFPVLARILTDRGMERTELGTLALGCAAADDVTAWCLLAFVVGVAQSNLTAAVMTIGLAVGYIAFMFLLVRPLAHRWLHSTEESTVSSGLIAWVIVALLVSALVTEAIGIHAIFGAFLLGAVIPHHSAIARVLRNKLEEIVTILFLPAFFAFTGMRTEIGLVRGPQEWLVCVIIIAVATLGKFGGTWVAARLSGLDSRMSASLGILMNTRGLMELIVLNIGLDLGVISPTLFAMMVLMAITTTVATSPVLSWIRGHEPDPATANSV